MKKILTITLLSILAITNAFSCDICGGGTGSYYIGLLPQFNKKLIGIRYQYNQLYTNLDINGNKTALSNKEQFQTIDIWGAWNIGSKWRVMAVVPYSFIKKNNIATEQINKKQGLSDITLTGYYNLLRSTKNGIKQSIWIGAGLKLSSGKYNNLEVTNNSPNIFQLGTGSTDFLTQINYDLNIKAWGLNTIVNYKINTKNADDYKYGNKLNTNLTLYRKISVGTKAMIIPNIGLSYENQEKNQTMNYAIDQTGGNILQGSYGIEASFGKIAIGLNLQNPISQNIASHRVDLKNKVMTHLSYTF